MNAQVKVAQQIVDLERITKQVSSVDHIGPLEVRIWFTDKTSIVVTGLLASKILHAEALL